MILKRQHKNWKKIQTTNQFAQSSNIVIQLYHTLIKTQKKNIFVVQLHLQTRGFSNITAANCGLPLSATTIPANTECIHSFSEARLLTFSYRLLTSKIYCRACTDGSANTPGVKLKPEKTHGHKFGVSKTTFIVMAYLLWEIVNSRKPVNTFSWFLME